MDKKKLIKIASVFFVGMIVLTILARVTDNMLVAQVVIGRVSAGSIDHTLEIEGVIMHNQEKALVALPDLRIQTVHVEVGERVEAGDLLMTLDMEELAIKVEELEHSIARNDTQYARGVDRAQADYNAAVNAGETSVEEALRLYNEAVTRHSEAQNITEGEEVEIGYVETCYQEMVLAKSVYDNAVAEKERAALDARRVVEDAKSSEVSQLSDTNLLAELKKIQENAGEIRAEESTQILEILGRTGEKTTEGALMRMVDVTAGLKVQAGISMQEAKQISIGTQVTVTGTDTVGNQQILEGLVVRDVISGVQTEGGMESDLIIVVDLKESSLNIGTLVTIKTLDNEKQYPSCVPIEALYQDATKQYFVFMMEEKKGILGDGYVAYRIDVEVIDKDNQYAALKADTISDNMEVIVQSSKAIEEGSRVRQME